MGAIINFGGGHDARCSKAFLGVMSSAIERHASDDPELKVSVENGALLQTIGGWGLNPEDPVTPTSLRGLRRLQDVLRALELELPGAISHWNEDFRPRFFVNFEDFRRALDARVAQLSAGGDPSAADRPQKPSS